MQLSITPLIQQAVEIASTSYDLHLAKTLVAPENKKLQVLLESNFADDTSFSIQESLEELEHEQMLLNKLASNAADIPLLMREIDRYVRAKVEELFFENNDLRLAHLKREFLEQFVIAASGILMSKGLLAQDEANAMKRLVGVYDTGIVTAMNMQSLVRERTHGHTPSLIEWAIADLEQIKLQEAIQAQATKPTSPPQSMEERADQTKALFSQLNTAHKPKKYAIQISAEETSHHANTLFRHMLAEEYGLELPHGETFHPCMLHVAALSKMLAEWRVSQQLGDRIASEEEIQALGNAEYQNIMAHVAKVTGGEPFQQRLHAILDYLHEEKCALCGIPTDYDAALERAADRAGTVALAAVSRRFRQWEQEVKLNWPDSRSNAELQNFNIGTLERTHENVKSDIKKIKKAVAECQTPEALHTLLNEVCDQQAVRVISGGEEPALLLVFQDYVKAMGKELAGHLRARGFDCRALNQDFAAIEMKYSHAYESNRAMADWIMAYTDGAYDSISMMAIMHECYHAGRHYSQLSDEQKEEIPSHATTYLSHILQDMQIPLEIGENPFIPLLFEECLNHARREYAANNILGEPGFSDKITAQNPPGKRTLAKFNKSMAEYHGHIHERALVLLDEVVDLFPSETRIEKFSGKRAPLLHHAPLIDAKALEIALEYLQRNQSPCRLH